MQYPTLPPPSPEQQAQTLMGVLERQSGIRFELWHKTFRAMPSSRLEPKDRVQLIALKAAVLAELHRRADAWSPE